MGRITASRKQLKPDPVYGSILASKFINCLMYDGKKSTAQQVFYDAMDLIKERLPDAEPIEVFQQALENVKPSIEVRSKRVGGAFAVERGDQLVGQLLGGGAALLFADGDQHPANRQRLLTNAVHLHRHLVGGAAVSRRENVHRMADANKAFAHFGW